MKLLKRNERQKEPTEIKKGGGQNLGRNKMDLIVKMYKLLLITLFRYAFWLLKFY